MPFEITDDLSPDLYPLAWLVGTWRGQGVIKYPGIDEAVFVNDVTFDHDGGPYLRYESTIRVLDNQPTATDPAVGLWPDIDASIDDDVAATVWSTETGYWRVSSERPDDLPENRFPIEVLIADASGRASLFLGTVGQGRIDLATDFVARTTTATEVTASQRMYGFVEGDLLWHEELAAFGNELQPYASARLAQK